MAEQGLRIRIHDIIFEANNLDDKVFDIVFFAGIIPGVGIMLDDLEREPVLNNSRPV